MPERSTSIALRITAAAGVIVAGHFAKEATLPHEAFANGQSVPISANLGNGNQTEPQEQYCIRPNADGFNPRTGEVCLDVTSIPNPTPVIVIQETNPKADNKNDDPTYSISFFIGLVAAVGAAYLIVTHQTEKNCS